MGRKLSQARMADEPCASRRHIMQAGAALSLAPMIASVWSKDLAAAEPGGIAFYKVLFDQNHPAALAFGREAAAAGLRTQAIGGDVTDLWYHDLYHRWREAPVAIAGLTTASAAFCLDILGRDVGMRTVFRAEHRLIRGGQVRHMAEGPTSLLTQAALLDTGRAWGQGAARLVARCPAPSRSAPHARGAVTLDCAATAAAPEAIEPLVSWVIAPVRA